LARNLEALSRGAGRPVLAVIKANAYGHGLVPVARFLESRGVDSLMVGKLQEAIALRESGLACPVYNFGPFDARNAEILLRNDIVQFVFDDDITELSRLAVRLRKTAKINLHLDTGMNRMGVRPERLMPCLEKILRLGGVRIVGVSTTLTEDPEVDRKQHLRFLSVCDRAEEKGITLGRKHLASSSALLNFPEANEDMVRPGILLYGYYPSKKDLKEGKLPVRKVLSLKSRVASTRTLRKGESASYHGAFSAREKATLAIIPLGYSDGYPSSAIGHGWVLIRGMRCPVVALTANHLSAVIAHGKAAEIGDEVVILGAQDKEEISGSDIADWAGVSVYQILMRLNPTIPKVLRRMESLT
jgi:alanine racemase